VTVLYNEITAFLRRHEEYCLFLLSNLEKYGQYLGESPYSGDYNLVRRGGKIKAVFSLTREGSLHIYSELGEEAFHEVLDICLQEKPSIRGVFGHWEFCQPFWEFIKKMGIVENEILNEKDVLYSLDSSGFLGKPQEGVRFLLARDYEVWKHLRLAYCKELGFPMLLSEKQLKDVFLEKTNEKVIWGYFREERLVSIADLNAKALDIAQLGGVYTIPKERRNGYSKLLMMHLIDDAFKIHSLRKLIIFTGEKNMAARKVYESLGVKPIGFYALFFADSV